MQVKIKGIFSPELLKKLILKLKRFTNHATYVALCLDSFFGFFRSGSLCPDILSGFDRTTFPVLGDVIWGPPGAHILITCSKTMQKSTTFAKRFYFMPSDGFERNDYNIRSR